MLRIFGSAVFVACAAAVSPAAQDTAPTKTAIWTGWFSDRQCAAPRVSRGVIGPNNPECVKRCLDNGATPVFVSEQAKALYDVTDYSSVKNDLGYHIEVTGVVDETAKTISVKAVKHLSEVGSLCALPKK
jgi:hypothetical protein